VEGYKLTESGVSPDDPKIAAVIKKMEPLDEKIKQLSEEDQKIWMEEVQRLGKAAGLPGF
jgi:uncharacterized protein YdcH (DUF465 family)